MFPIKLISPILREVQVMLWLITALLRFLRSCIFAPSTAHDQFNKYFVQTKVFLLNKLITTE